MQSSATQIILNFCDAQVGKVYIEFLYKSIVFYSGGKNRSAKIIRKTTRLTCASPVPVTSPNGKTRITVRLNTDILNWFQERVHDSGGGNYQTLIN